jgi:hypothetical protein
MPTIINTSPLTNFCALHVLFCVKSDYIAEINDHFRSLPGVGTQLRSAHFLVRDGESLDGLSLPEERYAFQSGEALWQFTDPAGSVRDVPATPAIHRVYRASGDCKRSLKSIANSEILTVKAGINQLSVALLLDTGASDNYMSTRLAKSLNVAVVPDHQGLTVTLADGRAVGITGSVLVPVCIGRYRAKIEFLITDLDVSFDAVLGYTWLRRNCDLHFSKNLLAFRNGAKVTCIRLPTVRSTGPQQVGGPQESCQVTR